jgi:nicotinate-nucleotide adenylyltransferase
VKTGLFFGSFNPVHVGHMVIANYFAEFADLDQVWFVVSPQNPLKEKKSLLADYHRYEMVFQAIGDSDKLRASNIEMKLPKPSYTIDTLTYLSEKFLQNKFVLIMGADNLMTFHKWKNYETILKYYEIYVYPRPGFDVSPFLHWPNLKVVDAPLMEISSSFIRKSISEGKDMRYFMPFQAYNFLREMHFYENH